MRCEESVKIVEILRLLEQGYSQRDIAASVKCGKSTVGDIQKRCREQGLEYSEACIMTNTAIRERLYPGLQAKYVKGEPDWETVHKRLLANRRMNLQYLWEEYRETESAGLGYSQFCRRYHIWREKTGKEVVMS
jgi:transposase